MAVTATVEESCQLNARPVIFGAMPSEHDSIDAHSTVALTCTPEASYVVTMDDGRNGWGGGRRMADATGAGYLAYDIFSDAGRTRRWGATAASAVSAVAPSSGRVELGVYARLAAGPTPAGAYADTVTVTVAF